jgi:hypothetical protein
MPEESKRLWADLSFRLQRRAIRVIDISTILFADGLIIGIGSWVARVAAPYFSSSGSEFFESAKKLSEGVFLLLYIAFAAFDIFEYLRAEQLFVIPTNVVNLQQELAKHVASRR